MTELLSFLILISAGLFLSEFFRRFNVPYVVSLIIAGMLIGPYGLKIFTLNETLEFLGSIGLVFLMFMAGLEIKLSSLRKLQSGVLKISLINGLVPFLLGFSIASYFEYDFIASLMLGIIFISSSIAVVIPSLEANKLLNSVVGKSIVSATIFEDVFSLVLLSVLLQTLTPSTSMPLPVFYLLVFTSLVGLKVLIPKLREFFFHRKKSEEDLFEQEFRFIFAILIGTVVFFDFLGVHAIIAGFFTGLVLSDSMKSELLKKKLHAISYGLFIPAFFIIIGSQTDITVFSKVNTALFLTLAVLIGSAGSKFISGWIGGRLSGFDSRKSAIIGASTIPQLSTTLAVAFVGLELKVLDSEMVTAMIILSIVTTLAGPILISSMVKLRDTEKSPLHKLKLWANHMMRKMERS